MPKLNHKRAFTLIELLIVIVLIGILAAVGFYMTLGRVAQSRDAVRKADLDKVKKALELAKAECTSSEYYPISAAVAILNPKEKYNHATSGLAIYLKDPDLNYLKKSPYDPINNSTYYYGYAINLTGSGMYLAGSCPGFNGAIGGNNGSKDYRLIATLEKTNDPDIAKSKADCPWSSEFFATPDYTSSNVYVVCPD